MGEILLEIFAKKQWVEEKEDSIAKLGNLIFDNHDLKPTKKIKENNFKIYYLFTY